MKAIPAVEAAGFVSHLPLGGRGSSGYIDVQEHPSDPSKKCREADRRPVTADYFRTMGIALVKGRCFYARDDAGETPRVARNSGRAKTRSASESKTATLGPTGSRFTGRTRKSPGRSAP